MKTEHVRPCATVVIIAYNDETHIERAIQSACDQTERSIEIICVNDGSTDSTYERMLRCAKRDERIRVVTQPNSGALGARYAGFRQMTGDYALFLDSDDTLVPEAVETACGAADELGTDVLEFGVSLVKAENDASSKEVWAFLERYFSQSQPLPNADHGPELVDACFVGHAITWNIWNKCYRAELLRKAFRFYRGEWVCAEEDMLLTLMVLCQAERYARIPQKLYAYTIGSGVSTTTKQLSDTETIKKIATEGLTLKLAREWMGKLGYAQGEIMSGMEAMIGYIRGNITWSIANRVKEEKRGEYLELLSQNCERNEFFELVSEALSLQHGHINRLEEDGRMLGARIERLEENGRQLEGCIERLEESRRMLEAQNRNLTETAEARLARIEELQESFDTISNATCWKITKPIRAALDFLKQRNK